MRRWSSWSTRTGLSCPPWGRRRTSTPPRSPRWPPGTSPRRGGLASLIGEKEFSVLFHEGERDNMHISVVDNRLILVVIFDKRSSVGLVRLRARRAGEGLGRILKSVDETARREEEGGGGVIEELTEADIESLFK